MPHKFSLDDTPSGALSVSATRLSFQFQLWLGLETGIRLSSWLGQGIRLRLVQLSMNQWALIADLI